MEKKYLIVNLGSSSKKYALYGPDLILSVHLEKESDRSIGTVITKEGKEDINVSDSDYESGSLFLIKLAQERKYISDASDIISIGIRVVSPGSFFQENKAIDQEYIERLKMQKDSAPLHISPTLEEIENIKVWASGTPLYGISDSHFYSDMDMESKLYGIDKDIASELELYRFGYHGISMESVLDKIRLERGSIAENIIICHLGSGSTVTAIKNGRPIDTSMGFTPLEGLVMGSRVGNIDAGAVMFMLKRLDLSVEELELKLNKESGLFGISKKSPYVKELLELEAKGDKDAATSLSVFVRSVKKYIGAYSALLGGLDLLVFTATIGERSTPIRERICSGLEYLNLKSDQVIVVPTDEMGHILKEVITLSSQ